MRQQSVPSSGRILVTDYWAFLSLVGVLVGWAIYFGTVFLYLMPKARGMDPLMGEGGAPSFFWIALAATAVGVPGLLWRTFMIRGVFEWGVQVEGVITSVVFYRDRGRADFSYTYQDERYRGGNPLHKTARTRDLREGQQVTLAVDPQKPERAFIQHLFVDAD